VRTLTITAAEWASVQDGTLWLVREGWPEGYESVVSPVPPVEFVQACAPCEACDGTCFVIFRNGDLSETYYGPTPCPDCRIELVGPCPDCGGDGWTAEHDSSCDGYERCYALGCPVQVQCASCQFTGIATLGHAYAVGEPLLLHDWPGMGISPGMLKALAHAGPVEWLVGKWALRLEVVGS